ncbi:MAG: hypothetical protein AAF242_04900, partial [Bacteroidota bacterium]
MKPFILFFLLSILGVSMLSAQTVLQCGVPFSGTTIGEEDNFNFTDYGGCYSGASDFDGPDQLFRIDIPDFGDLSRLGITLFSTGADDLDIFLFDESITVCLEASLRSVSNNNTFEFIFDRADDYPPGTYYLVVDGFNSAQADDFELTLTCGNFYFGYQEITCNNNVFENESTQFGDNEISVLKENGRFWPGYTGRGNGYYFDVSEEEEVTIILDPIGSTFDLDMLLSSDFDPYNGIAISNRGPGQTETISETLSPGRYFILVEGIGNASGTYSLSVDFSCETIVEGDPIPISCGETLSGTNIGFISDYIGPAECDGGQINTFEYQDVTYVLELDEAKSVEIDLRVLTEDLNLGVYLHKADFLPGVPNTPVTGSCVASGRNGTILESLEAGTYLIFVDGDPGGVFGGPPFPSKGFFELTVNCFDLPTPCDLDGEYVDQGFHLRASVYDTLDATADVLRELPFFGLDCVLSNYILSNSLGRVYTYFATTSGPTTLELRDISIDVKVDAFVFDCAFNQRSQSCLASTDFQNRSLTFNAVEGQYYQIVVLTDRVTQVDFTLEMTSPKGLCSDEDIELLQFDVEYDVTGAGNDFDITRNAFYGNCGQKLSSYLGEDRVFQLELRPNVNIFDANNQIDQKKFSYGVLKLKANEPMGIFLFNYQCGAENCVAAAELTEGADSVVIDLDLVIDKAGTYYLVVDKGTAGGDGRFTISNKDQFAIPNDNILCQFIDRIPSNIHTIQFREGIVDLQLQEIIVPGDRLIIDHSVKDNVGAVLYEPTTVLDWNDTVPAFTQNLPEIQLLRQEDSTRNIQVCGFEGFEEFSFKVIKADKSIWVLAPEITSALTSADPPTQFQGNAVTYVNSFTVANVEPFSKSDFEPESVNIKGLEPRATRFNAHIDANNIWSIRKKINSEFFRVIAATARSGAQSGTVLRSSSNNEEIVGGDGPLLVTIELDSNLSNDERNLSFDIETEAGFIKSINLTQQRNPCSNSTLALDSLKVVDVSSSQLGSIEAFGAIEDFYTVRWFDRQGLIIGDSSFIGNLDTGFYTLEIRDSECLVSRDSIFIDRLVNSLSPEIMGDTLLCAGDSTELIVGDFASYTWSTQETTASITIKETDTYSVTVTDAQGFTGVDSIVVVVSPPLAPQIVGDSQLCFVDSATLSLGAFTSYSWSTNETSATIVVDASGIYSVTIMDDQGCVGVDSFAVQVSDQLRPEIIGSSSVCFGDSTELSVGDYMSYLWSTGDTTSTITVGSSGTYSVTVMDDQGCVGVDSFGVQVRDQLRPEIIGASSLCFGDSTELSVGDYMSYLWSTGDTVSTITVSASGTYSVTVMDDQGCVGVDSFAVQVSDQLMPEIIGASSLCFGDSTELSVGTYSTYSWSTGDTVSMVTVSTSGTYSVTVMDDQGCVGVDSFAVEVSDQLLPEIVGASSLCFGDSTELSVGTYSTYSWSTGDTISTITVRSSGTYSVTVMDDQGCVGVDLFAVEVSDQLRPEIVGASSLCFGDSTELLVGDYVSYLWSTGDTVSMITVSASGTYTVTVMDGQGCVGVDLFAVEVSDQLLPEIVGASSLCFGDSTELSVGDYMSYLWSTGDTVSMITVGSSGTYSVTIMDNEGCVGVDSFAVEV